MIYRSVENALNNWKRFGNSSTALFEKKLCIGTNFVCFVKIDDGLREKGEYRNILCHNSTRKSAKNEKTMLG